MINEDSRLTEENQKVKDIILREYINDNISITYGCFYTNDGNFSFGKNKDNKNVMIRQKFSDFEYLELKDFNDDEIIRALDYIGLQRKDKKDNVEKITKNVENTQPMTLFDFM